ncbi:hypothetical protein NDU88_004317, partial [Pleurodeles waltl]
SKGRRRTVVEVDKAAEGGPSTSVRADGSAGPTAPTTNAGAGSNSATANVPGEWMRGDRRA